MSDTTERWRPVIAALANPHTRIAAARLLLGSTLDEAVEDLPSAKRSRARDALVAAGMVDSASLGLDAGVFRRILAENRVPPREGVERFLRDGRIVHYPAAAIDRRELLTVIAHQTFFAGEAVDECTVNARLSAYTDDVAVLRRYLVDHGLLQRDADGSVYRLGINRTDAAP